MLFWLRTRMPSTRPNWSVSIERTVSALASRSVIVPMAFARTFIVICARPSIHWRSGVTATSMR